MTDLPAEEAPVRVLLVDDQPLVRSGLLALLRPDPHVEVVAEAGDGAEAVVQTRAHRPDVVLMDIRMPVLDGLEATRRIMSEPGLADVRVVVLTTFDLDEYVFAALRAGASGFLLKHAEPARIIEAVRVVAAGDALLAPEVTRRLVAAFAAGQRGRPDPEVVARLTARELEAVRAVALGRSNDEIAADWVVAPVTVRTHVHRAMAKLGARDRAQLVVLAYEHRLAEPPG